MYYKRASSSSTSSQICIYSFFVYLLLSSSYVCQVEAKHPSKKTFLFLTQYYLVCVLLLLVSHRKLVCVHFFMCLLNYRHFSVICVVDVVWAGCVWMCVWISARRVGKQQHCYSLGDSKVEGQTKGKTNLFQIK